MYISIVVVDSNTHFILRELHTYVFFFFSFQLRHLRFKNESHRLDHLNISILLPQRIQSCVSVVSKKEKAVQIHDLRIVETATRPVDLGGVNIPLLFDVSLLFFY
jgi:hypothetical protein